MNWRSPVALTALCIVLLAGCSSERPAHDLRRTADRSYDHGKYAAAAAEYEQIVDRYPGDWLAQYKLGLCFLQLTRFDDARTALEVAYTRRPHNLDVIEALAETMYLQQSENELYAFLRERAQATQSARAYLRLAKYAIKLGDPDSAQLAFDTAIAVDEGVSIEPYIQAAAFAADLGRTDIALRRLRQAYGIDPHNETVHQRLRELGEIPGPSIALPPGP